MAYTQARVDAALDAANSGVAWAILHTGSPGANGTNSQASQSSPVEVSLSAASSGESSGVATFTINGAEGPYTFISLWDDSGGGSPDTFYGSGALTPEETFAGPGSLEVT